MVARFVSVMALGLVGLVFTSLVACSGDEDKGSNSSTDKSSTEKSSDSKKSSDDDDDDSKSQTPSKDDDDDTKTPSKKDDGAQCKESSECKSDFCVFKNGGSLGMCTKTCEDDINCSLGEKCVSLGDAPQKACVPE